MLIFSPSPYPGVYDGETLLTIALWEFVFSTLLSRIYLGQKLEAILPVNTGSVDV